MSTAAAEGGRPWTARVQRHLALLIAAAIGTAIFFAVAIPSLHLERTLREGALICGYALLALIAALALFNVRKRLSMVPLIRVRLWTIAHAVGGVLALSLFWLHAGIAWPTGGYEQALAATFYLVTLSGLLGLLLQQVYPRWLTQTGLEVIYERIPGEIAAVRDQAEGVILACTEEQRSDTLARFYLEALHWFFRRPRFVLSHLWGGQRASFWVTRRVTAAARYLGAQEMPYLDRLRRLAETKVRLDLHYAVQGALKTWLLVHVPAVGALALLALWHLLLVNIYAL